MKRRALFAWAGAAGLISRAQAQQLPRIAYLCGRARATDAYLFQAFQEGLAATGYVEGRSVTIDTYWADGHYDRLAGLATELVKSKPALMATVGGTAVPVAAKAAAKAAASALPIVFMIGADPVALGLVDTLARPGGNMTGVTLLSSSLEGKRIDLLHEMLPGARSLALLVNPSMPGVADQVRDAERTAHALGLGLQILKAQSEADLDAAVASLAAGTDGLAVAIDGFFISQRERILALTNARRLSAIFPARDFCDAGGLASYATSWPDRYRALGTYAGRILKGALPMDLPVQEPTSYELVVNLKAAGTLGITLPPTFVSRADEVIE
jgi:putative ABC transport system substrate-binding protein